MYRHEKMAESVAIPEFFVTEIGMLESVADCVRVTWAAPGYHGGTQLLIPSVSIIRPAATVEASMQLIERYMSARRFRDAYCTEILRTH